MNKSLDCWMSIFRLLDVNFQIVGCQFLKKLKKLLKKKLEEVATAEEEVAEEKA